MAKRKTVTASSSDPRAASPAITSNFIEEMVDDLMELMDKFMTVEHIDTALTGKERRRLYSAGIKNYGFIDKAWDIAHDNPTFMPSNLDVALMGKTVRDIEDLRQLLVVLEQFQQVVNDFLLTKGDAGYRFALRVYGILKEQAKNKVPGAQPLFEELTAFFHRRRRAEDGEHTFKELDHNFNQLIKGKADCKIEIINERPNFTAGKRVIVDEVDKGKKIIKGSEEIDIDDSKRK
jgi:hypothetical protein